MKHYLNNDLVFKIFFTRYVEHLVFLINELLGLNITDKDITFINNDLFGRSPEDKHCILDLAVKVNNETIIIEMQNRFTDDLYKRFDYYICLTYVNQLKSKDYYDKIDKVIGIFFINQDSKLFPDLFAKCVNYDIINKQELPETKVECFINLTKIKDCHKYGFSKDLENFLRLISSNEEMEIRDMAIDDEKLKRAIKALDEINADEELSHYLALKSANDIYDATQIKRAHREGIESVAKNMLSQNIDIDIISKSTGLSHEELKNLQANL